MHQCQGKTVSETGMLKSLALLSIYLFVLEKQFIFCKAAQSPTFLAEKWQVSMSC